MAEDLMRYDLLAQDALARGGAIGARPGGRQRLPGEHHLFIALDTRHPEVQISDRLRQKYPEEITIVLQHQFWNLEVRETEFSVELTFDNVLEKLVVPYTRSRASSTPRCSSGCSSRPSLSRTPTLPKAKRAAAGAAARKAGAASGGGNEPGPAKESEE
jgi:uncharacterized protein